MKLSLGEKPKGRRHLQRQDHNSPPPGEAERWSGNLGQEWRVKFNMNKDREGSVVRESCDINMVGSESLTALKDS